MIHAGATRNYTFYPADKLKGDPKLMSGLYSWTHPYPKPVIKNHDTSTEPLGRMGKVEFGKGLSGRECLIGYPNISDQEAINKVQDKRYLTVSIGAETDSATCSICGANILEVGFCGHQKGQKYDKDGEPDPNGETAYWIVGNVWFDELSFVNVPADRDAVTVDVGELTFQENLEEGGNDEMLTKEQLEAMQAKLAGEPQAPEELEEELETETPELEEGVEPEGEVKEEEIETPELQEGEVTPEVDKELEEGAEEEIEAKLAEAEEKVAKLSEQLKDVIETSLGLTEQVDELQSRIASAEEEGKTLLEENASLQAALHRSLAERVVDLKASLGKPGVEDRETAIQQHVERVTQSLQDMLNDLIAEHAATPVRTFIEKVSNPALAVPGEAKSIIKETGDEPANKNTDLTEADVIKRLFGGKK